MIRHTDAADAGVDADMERNGLLRLSGDFVERGTKGRVDHWQNIACDGVREILLVEWAEKQDGLANARIA